MRKGSKKKLKTAKEASPHSKPEVLLKTFRRYKNSKFQTLEILRSLSLHLIVTLPISIVFILLLARKANIVCLLFIVSQTYFNKNDFLLLLNNWFSLFFELLVNRATHITRHSDEDPVELCKPSSVGTGRFDKTNRRKLMW